jgi:hypothetical protein
MELIDIMKRIVTELLLLFVLAVGSLMYSQPGTDVVGLKQYEERLITTLCATSTCESCYLSDQIHDISKIFPDTQDQAVVLKGLISVIEWMKSSEAPEDLRKQYSNFDLLLTDIKQNGNPINHKIPANTLSEKQYEQYLDAECKKQYCPIFFLKRELRRSVALNESSQIQTCKNKLENIVQHGPLTVLPTTELPTNDTHTVPTEASKAPETPQAPPQAKIETPSSAQLPSTPLIIPQANQSQSTPTPKVVVRYNTSSVVIYSCVVGALIVGTAWILKKILSTQA